MRDELLCAGKCGRTLWGLQEGNRREPEAPTIDTPQAGTDHVFAQITGESIPNPKVRNWRGVVWRTWKVSLRHRLWTAIQCFEDRVPIRLAVAMVPLRQVPPQRVAVDANLTRSTDRHLPGLVVANDSVGVEGWGTEIVI